METPSLSFEIIQENLNCKILGSSIIVLESIDSTNTFLKSLAPDNAPEGTLIIAEEQTAGRGRMGRNWLSQKGKNLTFSILLKPHTHTQNLGLISLLAGLAITRAVHTLTSLPAENKWPNDVLIHNKKVCGILSEILTNSNNYLAVIVGIGLNVNQTEFPVELRERASSISLEAGVQYDRVQILHKVLEEVEYWYIQFQENRYDEIIQEWKKYCPVIGQSITISQNEKITEGIFKDVADDGALLLEVHGAAQRVYAGDVTVVKGKQ